MIALLGLSLTDCKAGDPDPIIGDWSAVRIDMETYPVMSDEGPVEFRFGIDMHIEADLLGELEFYGLYSYEEDDITARSEYAMPLTVEAEAGPTYRITVRGFEDILGDGGDVYVSDGYSENGGYGETSYGETGYGGTGYAETGYSETGSGVGMGGAPQVGGDRSLRRSSPAGTVLTLSCTLADDDLDCTNTDKSDPESFQSLRFVRKTPESN